MAQIHKLFPDARERKGDINRLTIDSPSRTWLPQKWWRWHIFEIKLVNGNLYKVIDNKETALTTWEAGAAVRWLASEQHFLMNDRPEVARDFMDAADALADRLGKMRPLRIPRMPPARPRPR